LICLRWLSEKKRGAACLLPLWRSGSGADFLVQFQLKSGVRLQAVQEGNSAFGMGCRLKNGTHVVFEDLQPRGDISGVIVARLDHKTKIGGEEHTAKFGNQLLAGVSFITPGLAAEVTVQALFVAGPMALMPISA
jgi:hypothetical protein